MFWPEALTFQQFYDSPTGHIIGGRIQQKIAVLWPDVRHETVIGLGFPLPYLEDYIKAQNHVAVFMPAPQGVLYWPASEDNRCCLSLESSLPLADNSVDKIILVHMLEHAAHPHLVIREMWRVLAPKGKLLVIVPNRLGVWAHLGKTPFSSGRAFHLFELVTLLQDAFFLPLHTASLVFSPPIFPHFLMKSTLLENMGNFWLQPFGGIIIAEGEKQLYSATTPHESGIKSRVGVFAPSLG